MFASSKFSQLLLNAFKNPGSNWFGFLAGKVCRWGNISQQNRHCCNFKSADKRSKAWLKAFAGFRKGRSNRRAEPCSNYSDTHQFGRCLLAYRACNACWRALSVRIQCPLLLRFLVIQDDSLRYVTRHLGGFHLQPTTCKPKLKSVTSAFWIYSICLRARALAYRLLVSQSHALVMVCVSAKLVFGLI